MLARFFPAGYCRLLDTDVVCETANTHSHAAKPNHSRGTSPVDCSCLIIYYYYSTSQNTTQNRKVLLKKGNHVSRNDIYTIMFICLPGLCSQAAFFFRVKEAHVFAPHRSWETFSINILYKFAK